MLYLRRIRLLLVVCSCSMDDNKNNIFGWRLCILILIHSTLLLDTGIANEKDWGISLLTENVNESGTNEDGSTWYRESGEDIGDNGYRCRWTRMGGTSHDASSQWKETVS